MRLIWSINLVCALTNKLAALERNIETLLTEEKCFRTADLLLLKNVIAMYNFAQQRLQT